MLRKRKEMIILGEMTHMDEVFGTIKESVNSFKGKSYKSI